MEEIRLGTIGSGVIVHSVLDVVRETEGIRLCAVYSRTRETGEALASAYRAENVYTDMDAFLADERINCVYIASPNSLHAEQTRCALRAGKHVICEKPFCLSAADSAELIAYAAERGLMLAEAAPTSFLPNYRVLLSQLDRIGRIRLVIGNYSQYSSRYDLLKKGETPNIFHPSFGGGCLMDINFYNVWLCIALFGKPRAQTYHPNLFSLAGRPDVRDGCDRIDTSGVMTLQYDDFVCTLAGAKDADGDNRFLIEGEDGYIVIPGGSNGLREIRIVADGREDVLSEQPRDDRWYYEVRTLTKMLLEEETEALRKRLDVTHTCVQVLEEARQAAGLRF